jgi:N-acetylmuramoyl-L-alanine amidase
MLQQLSIYLLKVICISGLLFLYYHLALRNKQFHYYNRFYLLLTVMISMVLPLLQLRWFTFFSGSPQTIHLFKIVYGGGEEEVTATGNSGLNGEQIALFSLAITSFIMLIILCIRIIKIHRLKKKYPLQKSKEFDFINTDISAAPFSFLKNIFWRNDISLNDETGRQILQHEIAHVKQKHSWDKLFMQIVLCFYWLNPFYHLLKRELYLIHEFIADEKAVKQSDADAFAKMLLTAQFGKFNFLPAQSIFYSSIKRRLVMLTTSKKPQFSYLRRMMILPLTAAIVCLFAFTIKNKNADVSTQKIVAKKSFVLIVDAGHGGKDNGAFGNGLYEKNIALKIAEKINDLSAQYGIDVVLTRDNDVFMSPPEKSNFANAQNADAFISIHVNAAEKTQKQNSGFEVVLSKNSAQEFSNIILGSAIIQNLQTDFSILPTLQQKNTGIWILQNSTVPSALIECGYITNANDAKLLKDDAKIELMAQHILQGVAMYANNTFDKSKVYPLQNVSAKDTNAPVQLKPGEVSKPLYVLDGKIIKEEEFKKVNPDEIESVNVLKDKTATDKYGEKGKNGVVEITLKKGNDKSKLKEPVPPPPPPPVAVFTNTQQNHLNFPAANNNGKLFYKIK